MPVAKEKRILAATPIVLRQVAYFAAMLGCVESRWKSDATRVTEADLTLSKEIIQALRAAFPEDDCVSEEDLPKENSRVLAARFCWVLDPIDGTNNYARGVPLCGISLGLLEDGLPVYGWIYDHLGRRLLEGGPGVGIKSDGQPVALGGADSFDNKSLVTFHFPMPEEHLRKVTPLLLRNTARCLGSAALNLAYNALGHFDGAVDHNTKVWDIAAAHALLAAAGRRMVFLVPDPFPLRQFSPQPENLIFLAGNENFLRDALPLLK